MSETFFIRTEGGPCDGETRVANSHGYEGWDWPLPDVLPYGREGRYVKHSESGEPSQPERSRLVRGAYYRWEAAERAHPDA